MGYSTVDTLLSGSKYQNADGKGADVASASIQLASTIASAKANKPEFSKYVETACGKKPVKLLGINKKKRQTYDDCSAKALKDYAKMSSGSGEGSGGGTGEKNTNIPPDMGSSGGGKMGTKTLLLIGGGILVLGAVIFFIVKKRGN